jgi:hypothetical protein
MDPTLGTAFFEEDLLKRLRTQLRLGQIFFDAAATAVAASLAQEPHQSRAALV